MHLYYGLNTMPFRGQPLLVLFPVGTKHSNVVKFWFKLSMSLSMLVVLSVGRK